MPYRQNYYVNIAINSCIYFATSFPLFLNFHHSISTVLLCQYRHQFLHLFCHIISFIPQSPPFHFHSITTSISPSIPAFILAHNFLYSSISSIECPQYRLQFLLFLGTAFLEYRDCIADFCLLLEFYFICFGVKCMHFFHSICKQGTPYR